MSPAEIGPSWSIANVSFAADTWHFNGTVDIQVDGGRPLPVGGEWRALEQHLAFAHSYRAPHSHSCRSRLVLISVTAYCGEQYGLQESVTFAGIAK